LLGVPELLGVIEEVGVPVPVPLLLGVPELLGVLDAVGVTLGVLLSLGQAAPTQHIELDRVPPAEHSHVAQHPPFAHTLLVTARRREEGGALHTSQ
jgi:hypothetical protein